MLRSWQQIRRGKIEESKRLETRWEVIFTRTRVTTSSVNWLATVSPADTRKMKKITEIFKRHFQFPTFQFWQKSRDGRISKQYQRLRTSLFIN
jgi:hypothetical protein